MDAMDTMSPVPPPPPKLRPTPQERQIGPGKRYADRAAFDADMALFKQEQLVRKAQMAERERAQQKARDRSKRVRPTDDSSRRKLQKWQQNSRQHSFLTPTVETFFKIACLNRISGNGPNVFDRALDQWDTLLGRKAASPETRDTCLSRSAVYDRNQRVADLARAGVNTSDYSIQSDLDTYDVYVGDKRAGRRHGKGARMRLDVDGSSLLISCYDGHWVNDTFTGRGCAKHQNGDYEDGLFCDGALYDGFRVKQGVLEMVSDLERVRDRLDEPEGWLLREGLDHGCASWCACPLSVQRGVAFH